MILLLLIMLIPGLANAATYYVDKNLPGSDSNNCTAEGTPCLTIQGAIGKAQATNGGIGDTIYIKNGTYNETPTVTASGSAGSPFVIKNYAGHTPIIQAASTNHGFCLGCDNATPSQSIAYVTVEGLEITGYYFSGLKYSNASNIIIRRNHIHDGGTYPGTGQGNAGGNGIHGVSGYQITIEGNYIHNNGVNIAPYGHGIYITGQYYTFINNIVEYNYGLGMQLNCRAYIVSQDVNSNYATCQNWTISNNTLAYNRNGSGLYFWQNGGTSANSTVRNNIFLNNQYDAHSTPQAIYFSGSGSSSITATNNVWYSSLGITATAGTCTSCTISGNSTTNPNLTNAGSTRPASPDFTLTASSVAIDFGTTATGLAYNGTAPDAGAFETFGLSVCSIANATSAVINATFESNKYPPLLPATGVTTFTARKATVADTVTGVIRTGDNQLDITVQNAFAGGNAADISWASGNLTDSALIGGTMNQPFLPITNQSCTNNVGGAPSHLFIQAKFEFHGLRGTEAAPVVLPYSAAAENTNINVVVGGKARLRLALTCTTADCPPTGFYLYYSKDGGAYAVVPDSFGADNIAFCGNSADTDIPTSGTATTDQLSTAGTFVAAALVRTSNAIPTIDLAQNNKTEPEYCISWDTDATADATYDFRIYKQDGTAIDTYTVTPRATVRAMSAGMGF